MNFIEEYKKGQAGGNKGLYMGDGLNNIYHAINGVQRGRIYGIAAAPKVGKSTFTDYGLVINPYLECVETEVPIQIIYLSYEMDRVSKEFDYATHFLHRDEGLSYINLDPGITKEGKSIVELSSAYLRGRLLDDNGETIIVKPKVFEALQRIYQNRIIPLFGEYSVNGLLISKGIIKFIDSRDNPTGIYKNLLEHADKEGTFTKVKAGQKIPSYQPDDPNKYTIIVTDHLRKLLLERGWELKKTVDKYIEYSVELRNLCGFTFVHIIHLNRNMTSMDRIKTFSDMLYPNSDDIKDTGNLAEEADYVFTMFNPNDERYNLSKHFGKKIKDGKGNPLYPNMRTVHLVESRHCDYPQHFCTQMNGAIKHFEKLKI